MAFSFLVWNVEKFKATNSNRISEIANHIKFQDPDIFCILEFMGKSSTLPSTKKKDKARELISRHFPNYDFGLTDSKKRIEILVGWRRNKFSQVLYSQRREFKNKNENMRPGALLSVRQKGQSFFYNLLFLHADSGRRPVEYASRQALFKKIWKMNGALEKVKVQKNNSRFLVMGDLNTMGRKGFDNHASISAFDEVELLRKGAMSNNMRLMTKYEERSWSNPAGTMRSPLDHVIACDKVNLQQWVYDGDARTFEIDVQGWNSLTGVARRNFIENISDHCSLWGQVI